ncbi:hypothetical protein SAMN05445504_2414 [Burkholderia sp. CF099]|nr:hypothetical protein SAMN05445504_2414 [Burkholderia sp. CF099]
MSEEDINRWANTVTPRDKAPQPWTIKSGGSWDMLDVQPIPDAMLAELAQVYHRIGTPWNCRSLPLMPNDREYMFLLYYSMQGLVARMRRSDALVAELLVVANDFEEALGELHLFCECGQEDCRTTRLRAALAKATGAA